MADAHNAAMAMHHLRPGVGPKPAPKPPKDKPVRPRFTLKERVLRVRFTDDDYEILFRQFKGAREVAPWVRQVVNEAVRQRRIAKGEIRG